MTREETNGFRVERTVNGIAVGREELKEFSISDSVVLNIVRRAVQKWLIPPY